MLDPFRYRQALMAVQFDVLSVRPVIRHGGSVRGERRSASDFTDFMFIQKPTIWIDKLLALISRINGPYFNPVFAQEPDVPYKQRPYVLLAPSPEAHSVAEPPS